MYRMDQYLNAEIDKRFEERAVAGSGPSKSIISLAMYKELSNSESTVELSQNTLQES